MTFYRVFWEIEVDADTPEQAAEFALDIQRDPESGALCFQVENERGKTYDINLDDSE